MALQTDDIMVNNDDWNEIPLLDGGSFVEIAQVRDKALIKVGNNSNTKGIMLDIGDNIKAPESIYVKRYYTNEDLIVTVIRDKS